jgi:UrcA family protein
MKYSRMARSLVAMIAIAAISAPVVVTAQQADEIKGKAVKVAYVDLNLEKEPGARVLYRRLQQASKTVCGVASIQNAGSAGAVSKASRCYRETLTAQVKKFDNEWLTKIHEG